MPIFFASFPRNCFKDFRTLRLDKRISLLLQKLSDHAGVKFSHFLPNVFHKWRKQLFLREGKAVKIVLQIFGGSICERPELQGTELSGRMRWNSPDNFSLIYKKVKGRWHYWIDYKKWTRIHSVNQKPLKRKKEKTERLVMSWIFRKRTSQC